jgi:hypothetical protein
MDRPYILSGSKLSFSVCFPKAGVANVSNGWGAVFVLWPGRGPAGDEDHQG